MNKLYELIAKQLFTKLLAGKKLTSLGWLCTIVGALSVAIDTQTIQKLCDEHVVCLQGSTAFGIIIMVIGEFIKAFRAATALNHAEHIAQLKDTLSGVR
jgi:multisubunit Na+/H+ antiporter MnhG subunit